MSALSEALKEIFEYYGLLDELIEISLNRPEEYLDKIFRMFQEFVEMVQIIDSFEVADVQFLLNNEFYKYCDKPFFPVFAGLFLNALLKRLFQNQDKISIDLELFNSRIINNASSNVDMRARGPSDDNKIGYSLDFIGYLLPKDKVLKIRGTIGDYCGALMGENSTIILHGKHGKYFGYEKDPTAKIIVNAQ
ncbi:MAG: hypothetical protein ACTSU4_00825 [Promethearchaeota archaeon]